MRGRRAHGRAGGALLAVLLAVGGGVSGCASGGTTTSPPPLPPTTAIAAPTDPASGTPEPTPTAMPAVSAPGLVGRMSARQRAGAVLMTAATVEAFSSLRSTVRAYGLSGVMLRGRSTAGATAVGAAVHGVTSAAPTRLPLLVATDQEGGLVQVLRGPGFADIPSAVRQATWSPTTLRTRATGWGRSLADAGVNLQLGPVADTPCPATLHDNPPIADLLRNYGTDPEAAGRSVAAVVQGLRAAGVASTVKHFPGLGCVRENTDTTARVVDSAIGPTSARLQPFKAGIAAGAGFVMVSSAIYSRIDAKHQALYSSAVLTGLLRHDLGFRGVIMSDDVGGAVAVRSGTPGQRATRFIDAGGDLLLDIVPADIPAMVAALASRSASDPEFSSKLAAAATRVVAARQALAATG